MKALEILTWMSVAQLLGLCAVLFFHGRPVSRALAFFGLTVMGHLLAGGILDWPAGLFPFIHILALLPMPAFYLLSRSVFDDGFRPSRVLLLLLFASALAGWLLNFFKPWLIEWMPVWKPLLATMPQSFLSLFVLAAFYGILRGRSSDLIPWRYRLRIWILSFIGVFALAIALAEIYFAGLEVPEYLELIKVALILATTLGLMLWLLVPRDVFSVSSPRTLREVPTSRYSASTLLASLEQSIQSEKIHHTEGLTIGQLAAHLKCQEYRLRRLINGELGYPNFNQFLNAHRIQDAREILIDPAQADQTILTIAFDLGYQSLAPFNVAFRKITGETPTAFRNRHRGI
ncbi:MAG TPA: hypothetical protein DEA96_11525 [Leptospiraceae bacterium]|nr:hypothetical protein [Spirochaetaceae bacterium]HBS05590.1 hypothetical protein [Leptospiraceae bacterium]|tara:strand:- start:34187 stop:35221 length:1035 start_codon:yes stop_codon:yes gene_type:complete